jgi:hypothetical protein
MPSWLTLSGISLGIFLFGLGVGLIIDHWRGGKPDFDVVFVPSDKRFVAVDRHMIRYSIALWNRTAHTIAWPSIRVHDTAFAMQILTAVDPYNWSQPVGARYIFVGGAINPNALEFVPLFDLPTDDRFFRHPDLLSARHRFTLEAHGRDAKTLLVDFEYDPAKFPRIRKC